MNASESARAAGRGQAVRVFLRSARVAGRGAKQRRNPPVQSRFGGHKLRVFLRRIAPLISVVPTMLLNSCGAAPSGGQGTFSNLTYWKEFFAPGDTSPSAAQNVQPAAAAAPATSGKNAPALDATLNTLTDLYKRSDGYIQSFPDVEGRYSELIGRLNRLVASKQQQKSMSDVDRRTVAIAVAQTSAALDIQNDRVQSSQATLDQLSASALQAADQLEKECNAAASNTSEVPPGSSLKKCPTFLNALSLFRVRREVASRGFAHVNEAYRQARQAEEEVAKQFPPDQTK
jgi:hypothetical protein